MPKGSISQQPERPDTNNRHAQQATELTVPNTPFQHAADDVENMLLEELEWQINKTEDDILFLTRRLMRQMGRKYLITADSFSGAKAAQMAVAWIASRAHWRGDIKNLEATNDRMNDGDAR